MNITTANGDPFYEDEVQSMASAIFRRFGCDPKAASQAWRRLHQNQCSEEAFMSLLRGGAVTEARASVSTDKTADNALQALKEFVSAAGKLSNQWPDDGSFDDGYPTGLPSFDEFTDQLQTWLEKVQRG